MRAILRSGRYSLPSMVELDGGGHCCGGYEHRVGARTVALRVPSEARPITSHVISKYLMSHSPTSGQAKASCTFGGRESRDVRQAAKRGRGAPCAERVLERERGGLVPSWCPSGRLYVSNARCRQALRYVGLIVSGHPPQPCGEPVVRAGLKPCPHLDQAG